jgi:hypothetical protein
VFVRACVLAMGGCVNKPRRPEPPACPFPPPWRLRLTCSLAKLGLSSCPCSLALATISRATFGFPAARNASASSCPKRSETQGRRAEQEDS